MEAIQPRRQWTDFDDLLAPPGAAGCFMLAVPFDTLLRELSETYCDTPQHLDRLIR